MRCAAPRLLAMEEESGKRRERLQALRIEAASALAEPESSSASEPPAHLSNPLVQSAVPPSLTAEKSPSAAPRFDYYTDPMSAFSGAKRRSGGAGGEGYNHPSRPHAGPRNYHIPNTHIPVMPPFQVNHSPDQSTYQMSFPVPQSDQWRSPIQFGSPCSGHRGTQLSGPVWSRSGGSSVHGYSPNPSRGGFRTPIFGQGGSPRSNLGSGGSPMSHPGTGSPHSNSRRGYGWRFSGSPSNHGRSGGRVGGFHDSGLCWQKPEHFYIKSMVKDPWRKMKPIVGNIFVPRTGSGSWLPESLSTKKAKITETGNEFKCQSSLAEYLACSFEEAVNDGTTT